YGRPEVAAEHALAFNVSHTHGLIALGVSRQGVLGVDVESLLRPARPELAENLFAPAEHEDLQRLPPEQRGLRFYEYWTLKEAYIKARGMGLSLPLDKFAFGFPGAGRMSLKIDAALADDPDKWRLWQFRLGDFLLAICAESRQCARPRLAWRRLTSLQGFEALHPAPWRYSDGLE